MVRPKRGIVAEPTKYPREDVLRKTHQKSSADPPPYGDDSSTYWPPGWNYKRISEATHEELATIPEEEMEKMRAGIREALGEHGAGMMARHMYEENLRRTGESAVETAEIQMPNFMRTYDARVQQGSWGFVAMRTACYDDEDTWSRFKDRWNNIVRLGFEKEGRYPGVEEVERIFEIRWIEQRSMDGMDVNELREKYAELYPTLPGGLQQPVFLHINREVVDSVLDTAEPTKKSRMWRDDAPFVLAVSQDVDPGLEDGHEENAWIKLTFKVAIEVLIDQFWDLIASDMMPLRRVTRLLKSEADTWWSLSPSPEQLAKRRRVMP